MKKRAIDLITTNKRTNITKVAAAVLLGLIVILGVSWIPFYVSFTLHYTTLHHIILLSYSSFKRGTSWEHIIRYDFRHVFVTVSLLLFKSVIYPPTALGMHKQRKILVKINLFIIELCGPSDYVIIPLGTNGGNLSSLPSLPCPLMCVHSFIAGITEDNLSSFLLSKSGLNHTN